MRVHLLDPSADVLPYGPMPWPGRWRAEEPRWSLTSRFVHGPAPPPDGFVVDETFYRAVTRFGAGHTCG